jgi:hypothetical protein
MTGQRTESRTRETSEPCAVCAEETAVGTPFYAERHRIERADGEAAFLCALCGERVARSRGGRRLTSEELRAPDANGVWAIIATLHPVWR